MDEHDAGSNLQKPNFGGRLLQSLTVDDVRCPGSQLCYCHVGADGLLTDAERPGRERDDCARRRVVDLVPERQLDAGIGKRRQQDREVFLDSDPTPGPRCNGNPHQD
jgi:hypothetical protein